MEHEIGLASVKSGALRGGVGFGDGVDPTEVVSSRGRDDIGIKQAPGGGATLTAERTGGEGTDSPGRACARASHHPLGINSERWMR